MTDRDVYILEAIIGDRDSTFVAWSGYVADVSASLHHQWWALGNRVAEFTAAIQAESAARHRNLADVVWSMSRNTPLEML